MVFTEFNAATKTNWESKGFDRVTSSCVASEHFPLFHSQGPEA